MLFSLGLTFLNFRETHPPGCVLVQQRQRGKNKPDRIHQLNGDF